MIDNIVAMLGFAQRSNNLIAGNERVSAALSKGHVALVLIGSDVSEKSVKNLKNKCLRLSIPMYQLMTTTEQSRAIGKSNRTVIAITNGGFATRIIDLIHDMDF